MRSDDIKYIEEEQAKINQTREDLKRLSEYRGRIIEANSLEALKTILIERSEYIHSELEKGMLKKQKRLDEFAIIAEEDDRP